VDTRTHISTSTGNRNFTVQPVADFYTLFTYGLFNDTINSSGYISSNCRVTWGLRFSQQWLEVVLSSGT
jgi:hypothetical protein